MSVDIILLSLVKSSFSSMREINEDELAEVVVTIEIPRLEDADTDIGCVSLFGTNSELEDVVVDSVETTNMPRVKGLITALIGCVVLPGTTVEIVELDDTDIGCITSVDAEVEVEDLEEDISVGVEDPQLLLVVLTSLRLHGVEDDSSEGVEEPRLVLNFFLGLDSLCRG